MHELLDKLQEGDVSEVLHNCPSSDSFWSVINASHWPITKKITDKNVAHLVQNLLEREIILFKKFEGKEVCFKLLCNSIEQNLTPDEFNNLYDASVQRPSDFAQLHSYDWFMDYVMLVRRNSYVCCSSLLAFNQFHLMVSLTTLC